LERRRRQDDRDDCNATPVQGLTLSPNAQRIAVGLADGPNNVVRIHDIALGKTSRSSPITPRR